jgi:hypothetical protein
LLIRKLKSFRFIRAACEYIKRTGRVNNNTLAHLKALFKIDSFIIVWRYAPNKISNIKSHIIIYSRNIFLDELRFD